MALFKPSTWGLIKVIRDLDNYRDFIGVIKDEVKNPKSKFNHWKLKHNYFYTIYFTMDIEEEEAQLPEQIKRLRMMESLAPLHRYLDEELGFAGYLIPEWRSGNLLIRGEGEHHRDHTGTYRQMMLVFTT